MSDRVTIIAKGYLGERIAGGLPYFRASGVFVLTRVPVKGDIIEVSGMYECKVDSVYLSLNGTAKVYVEAMNNLGDDADEIVSDFRDAGFQVEVRNP